MRVKRTAIFSLMENKYMSQNFYCYSTRMSYFIRSFNIKYINVGFNAKSGTKYYVFEKSKKLDKVIELYNQIKHSV